MEWYRYPPGPPVVLPSHTHDEYQLNQPLHPSFPAPRRGPARPLRPWSAGDGRQDRTFRAAAALVTLAVGIDQSDVGE